MYPFERFSPDAKCVLTLAQQEAARSHHAYIGTEHLLVALLRTEGVAAQTLARVGVRDDATRKLIDLALSRPTLAVTVPTSRVKKAIDLAFESARQMGDETVDTEHLLLGLAWEGQGIAAQVLAEQGATVAAIEAAVLQLRRSPSARLKRPTGAPDDTPTAEEAAPVLRILADATGLARRRGETLRGEHLLLALSRSDWGRVAEILVAHGLTPRQIEDLLASAE